MDDLQQRAVRHIDETLSQKAEDCLGQMRSPDRRVREQALAELRKIPTESIMELLAETWQKNREVLYNSTPLDLSHTNAGLYAAIFLGGAALVWYLPLAWRVAALFVLLFGLMAKMLRAAPEVSRNQFRCAAIYDLLNACNDPRSIAIYSELFTLPPSKWTDSTPYMANTIERLIKLLPEISAETVDVMTHPHRESLRIQLFRLSRITQLTEIQARIGTAMIQYVTNVGDVQSLGAVYRIAARQCSNALELRMADGAKLAVVELNEIKLHGKAGEEMLRASESPQQNEVLLRAAVEKEHAQEDTELLRAGNGKEK